MAMRLHDQRLVNQYERPTSTDFNNALSYAMFSARSLTAMSLIEGSGSFINAYGFLDGGFKCDAAGTSRNVTLRDGMMFGRAAGTAPAGAPSGATTGSVLQWAYLSANKTVTVPSAPSAGLCRRDIIAVRPQTTLAEYLNSDIFNPTTAAFGPPSSVPKAFRPDLYDIAVETMPVGGGATATSPIVYIPGSTAGYTAPNDLLATALPTVPTHYQMVAVINVVGGEANIAQNRVADWRVERTLSNGPLGTVKGRVELGGDVLLSAAQLGLAFSQDSLTLGVPWTVVGDSTFSSNTYQLCAFANLPNIDLSSVRLQITPSSPLISSSSPVSSYRYAPMALSSAFAGVSYVDEAFLAKFDPLAAYPLTPLNTAQFFLDNLAIGQPYVAKSFSVGVVSNQGIGPGQESWLNTESLYWGASSGVDIYKTFWDFDFTYRVNN